MDMLGREQETRHNVNNRDLLEMTQAVAEIERQKRTLDYLCSTYKDLVMLRIKHNDEVEKMLTLLERINNVENQKTT